MKKPVMGLFILTTTAVLAASFFMPWVLVDANLSSSIRQVGRTVDRATQTGVISKVTNVIGDMTRALPMHARLAEMSGYNIARSGRSEFMDLAGKLLVFAGEDTRDPRQVRFLYFIPAIGFLLGLCILMAKGPHIWVAKLCGLLALAIGGVMTCKLRTLSLDGGMAHAELLPGIWITCGSFVVLGLLGLAKKR